ncbi:MAG: low temperature requirement protein [Solirubrobacterales bacterium]|nr:low temperature requirement protein [Solirubrobacterales bacterium]
MRAKLYGAMPEPVDEQEVTPLELFFDLVFVFAITQVSGFVSEHATWLHLAQGLAILAVLWWAWESYAWLGNTAASDEGTMRVVLLAAMGAMLVASLAVPHAFGANGLVFGFAYLAVRLLHLVAYEIVSRGDPELRGVVLRLATTAVPGALLIVLAGALHGVARDVCWVAALAIDYGGLALRGVDGWRVQPSHFAERHGLIIIIALGESIVSIGVGAGALSLSAGIVAGALLGVAVAAALWWAYFDVVAIVAERRLRSAPPAEQVRLARDSYTYLHMPMVAGIVVFAIGVKTTIENVGHHLDAVPAAALCGGVALYLLALSAFKRRNIGSYNQPRLAAAGILLVLAPVTSHVAALLALALVALVACGLIAYEVRRYAAARERIRHTDTREAPAPGD